MLNEHKRRPANWVTFRWSTTLWSQRSIQTGHVSGVVLPKIAMVGDSDWAKLQKTCAIGISTHQQIKSQIRQEGYQKKEHEILNVYSCDSSFFECWLDFSFLYGDLVPGFQPDVKFLMSWWSTKSSKWKTKVASSISAIEILPTSWFIYLKKNKTSSVPWCILMVCSSM